MKKIPLKDFWWLTFSTLLMAFGTYFFKFPNNFTFGGVTGLAVLVAKSGWISAGDFTFVMNMVLLLVGFLFFGKKFGLKTAYTSTLLSVSLSLMERIWPMQSPLTDEPLLELCFAIALPAIGSAILFNMEASSGGTDIIAMLLKKYTSVDIGRSLFLTDVIICVIGCFLFDIKTGLFSFLGLTIKSFLVDTVIENINRCKYFNVVCNKQREICDYIVHDLCRSATYFEAKGAFTGHHRYIIFTVLTPHEAVRLRNYIKSVDSSAFILISNTSEIIGKGFHSI